MSSGEAMKRTSPKEKVIEALEQEKKNQLALHHKKMCEIQEKIDSLLVLTYQPSEA